MLIGCEATRLENLKNVPAVCSSCCDEWQMVFVAMNCRAPIDRQTIDWKHRKTLGNR